MKLVSIPPEIERLASAAINAAYTVHKALGPGLLEGIYQKCLSLELSHNGISTEQEKSIPITYRGTSIGDAYRLDLLLENKLVLEIKAVETLLPVHQAQLITYLKLLRLPLGLLINFNVPLIKNGITRILNHDFQKEIITQKQT